MPGPYDARRDRDNQTDLLFFGVGLVMLGIWGIGLWTLCTWIAT